MRLTSEPTYPYVFPIRINLIPGSIYIANVTAYTTGELLVKSLKNHIENGSSYKLIYYNQEISDSETLENIGVRGGLIEVKYNNNEDQALEKIDESILDFSFKNSKENNFIISVKTQKGQTIDLYVSSSDTVYIIKLKIQDKEGFLADKQRIIFSGRELKDEHTLEYYNIKKEDTLHVVAKIRCEMFYATSGRKDFDTLPPLTQYLQAPEKLLQGGINTGISCNFCGEFEWE
ncbi:18583_t:CDS:2, partial [Racocetra fulgida]